MLPYEQYLKRFPAYLQQLTMESNGKHVTLDGERVDYATGPIYWGEPGTNGQHSFYQLLHQGTHLVPCDFIGFGQGLNPVPVHQDQRPRPATRRRPARPADGEPDRPGRSAGVRQDRRRSARRRHARSAGAASHVRRQPAEHHHPRATKLTPHALGTLVALYEHSVFVQGVIWDIDSFDQWGVELGKQLAKPPLPN